MANYHLSIKIISRGKGKSAVAAAAYRAGETIKNEHDGMVHSYSYKHEVVHKEILLPQHAPAEYSERSILWNAVEKCERFKNAQLAREIEFSLPVELSREDNIALARRFVNEIFVREGMCADVCVHDKNDGNPHAHVMLIMRPIEKDGKWGQKSHTADGRKIPTVDWNDRERAEDWRKAWAAYCNTALRIKGHADVLDHRSYARQGIEHIPTVHLGPAASRMEKRGIRTERGDMNRAIEISNKEIRQLRGRITKLEKWIAEESTNNEPPTLADIITDILDKQGQSGISKLKAASQMLIFLTENKITDMAELEQFVNAIRGKLNGVTADVKKVERRIATLNEHLSHSDNFKKYRKINTQYDKLYAEYETAKKATGLFADRKAKKALDAANDYKDFHHRELLLYNAAEEYLRGVLQQRFDPKKLPPVSMWRDELATKTAEKETLYRDYYKLKDETYKVEKIRASVKEIMQAEAPKRTVVKSKSRDAEL